MKVGLTLSDEVLKKRTEVSLRENPLAHQPLTKSL